MLVEALASGPLDIVGDLHGELDALRRLLELLGYDPQGQHPQGRKLVFVGDLVDRGPNSPGTVALVQSLVEAQQAQCLLGNHELNLLLGFQKHDNRWFYGRPAALEADGQITPQQLADETARRRLIEFFASLPLALERDDLCVVHAAWHDHAVTTVRHSHHAREEYLRHEARIATEWPRKAREHSPAATAPIACGEGDTAVGPQLPDEEQIQAALAHQNQNPIRRLTSGPECRAERPFFANGRWRYLARVRWWESYQAARPCIFGHYGLPPSVPRTSAAALCIDYGIGRRWRERAEGRSEAEFAHPLAALRWPERLIQFENGTVQRWE